jgi:integral membrane sensor domain MASE1
MPTKRVASPLLTCLQIAGIAGLYFITGKLGLLLAVEPGYATAIWPPSGIALVAILWLGYRMWPGVWLGSCLVNVSTSFDANTSALLMKSLAIPGSIATGAALQAFLGAFLIRRFIGFPTPLNNEREVFIFLGCGGMVGSLAGATVGITTLAVAGAIPWSNSLYSWGTWWIGDTNRCDDCCTHTINAASVGGAQKIRSAPGCYSSAVCHVPSGRSVFFLHKPVGTTPDATGV